EFRVNTYTTSYQDHPSVATDQAGDFVVAWESYLQDGGLNGVYAQRFNSLGAPQGGEFRVNAYTTGNQIQPSVAIDQAGNFIVAWSSPQDGSSYGVYAMRYNSLGVAQGVEFRVNAYTSGAQWIPSVAMDQAGDFVVGWQSYQGGSNADIYAQRYNSAGL